MEPTRYEKYKEYYQTYYQQNREHCLELQRRWKKANREHVRSYERSLKRERDPKKFREYRRKWRENNPEKVRAQHLLGNNLDKYPLDSECAFCNTTENLEHGHIDYDYPELYLSVCHRCNIWMDRGKTEVKNFGEP